MRKLALIHIVPFLAFVACTESTGSTAGAPTGQQLPAVKANLPPPPTFEEPATPEQYPDQTWSIYGVRKKLKDNLDQEIRLTASVLEIYECPCKGGKTTDDCTCERPHFWVADKAQVEDKEKEGLLISDLPYDDLGKYKKLDLQVGQKYTFTGTFTRQSNVGFASSEGLLIYREHGAVGEPPTPPEAPAE